MVLILIFLSAHSAGSGGSANSGPHHNEIRVGSATTTTVAETVKAVQALSLVAPAVDNNQPPSSNHPNDSHQTAAQGVHEVSPDPTSSMAPTEVAVPPTADYSHYNSKLTIQDFDLLKVGFEKISDITSPDPILQTKVI